MIPSSTQRVARHTSEKINEQIRRVTEGSIAHHALHRDQIDQRLKELDQEWDIERVLEANAATLAFFGTAMGTIVNRKWFILPAVVTGFLLQHAIQGWCPPVVIFRRLGVRTAHEIEAERYALKALRGDFKNIPTSGDGIVEVLRAVEQ